MSRLIRSKPHQRSNAPFGSQANATLAKHTSACLPKTYYRTTERGLVKLSDQDTGEVAGNDYEVSRNVMAKEVQGGNTLCPGDFIHPTQSAREHYTHSAITLGVIDVVN